MLFYKIYLTQIYDTEAMISNRQLERGYEAIGARDLIEAIPTNSSHVGVSGLAPFILVYVDENLCVREYFTNMLLQKSTLRFSASDQRLLRLNDLSDYFVKPVDGKEMTKLSLLRSNPNMLKLIGKAIFHQENDFVITTIEEAFEDKCIQAEAFSKGYTTIDPESKEYAQGRIYA